MKRYQYLTSEGIKWTKWFECKYCDDMWQLKGKLKNEYKDA